jgi:hypothetical protein
MAKISRGWILIAALSAIMLGRPASGTEAVSPSDRILAIAEVGRGKYLYLANEEPDGPEQGTDSMDGVYDYRVKISRILFGIPDATSRQMKFLALHDYFRKTRKALLYIVKYRGYYRVEFWIRLDRGEEENICLPADDVKDWSMEKVFPMPDGDDRCEHRPRRPREE